MQSMSNDNKSCLMRYGVEKNSKQSFIACIADIYHKIHNIDTNKITIKEMKTYIIDAITIDTYITYQNGNLVEQFYKQQDIDLEEFKDYTLYKKLITKNKPLLKKVICSFKEFINYMNDDTTYIDHEYLWDIVSFKNEKLIKQGLNLVILEVTDYDGTDDINLICPTNSYSSLFYSSNKPYLFLLKYNEYYEPIYSYTITKHSYEIKKLFNENESNVSQLGQVISNIKNLINKECIPEKDKHSMYTFEQNLNLKLTIFELKKIKNLTIQSLVLNNSGKVIGVEVNYDTFIGMIPCYPSSIIDTYDLVNVYDLKGQSYEYTKQLLYLISKKSNEKIACKPKLKILERNLIVGLLTVSNSFIRLKEPEENKEDELEDIIESDYYEIDNNIEQGKPNNSLFFIKKIELEDKFYKLFRNMLRIEINNVDNRSIKDKCVRLITSYDHTYSEKINKLNDYIKRLINDKLEFFEYDDKTLRALNDIGFCDSKEDHCLQVADNTYKLLIPLTNLVNKKNNKKFYYLKLADELIRYRKNRVFIFNLHVYTLLQNSNYNINENEILLLSSVLNQDYFLNMIPATKNKYIHSDTFDTTNPTRFKKTKQIKDVDQDIIKIQKTECNISIKSKITGKLDKLFIGGYLKQYDKTLNCTFRLILDIEQKYRSIMDLKKIIFNYLNTKDLSKVIKLMADDKKDKSIKKIKQGEITLEEYIMAEGYYLTNIDLWILANHLKLPIVLLSGTTLKETNTSVLVLYDNPDIKHYNFVRTSARSIHIPQYSIILDKNKHQNHKKQDMTMSLNSYIKENNKDIKLDEYMKS